MDTFFIWEKLSTFNTQFCCNSEMFDDSKTPNTKQISVLVIVENTITEYDCKFTDNIHKS